MSGVETAASALAATVARFRDAHVWVAGDVMLDEYVVGDVGRVSPEAPVPVVHVRETMTRLGGAANVARQIAALGARVSLCGTIGTGAAGDALLAACANAGIATGAVGREPDTSTTRKLRVLGHNQQLLRLDWEKTRPCPSPVTAGLVARLQEGRVPNVVVLSDYAKGFLTDDAIAALVAAAGRHRAPVLVDPKRRDLSAYRGATIIKPNLGELENATGLRLAGADIDTITEAARTVGRDAGVEAIVVTLGERGLLVVPADGPQVEIRGHRRAVYDVTGAGDTVVAVLALSLASGAGLEDAARIANAAAGVSVGAVGATAVLAPDLLQALTPRLASKVLSRTELAAQVELWRLQGREVVFTNGCFDLLHVGHLSLLREAARLGDVLVLAINSDASVRRLKGEGRPLVPQAERAALLAALDCVDAVTVFDEDTPLETLEQVRPDVLVKGQDYRHDEVVGRELVEAAGGRVELVPLLPERSTTALVDRIRKSQEG